ncbi:MAG TPA: beta-L-arabinofuranosidase domain-containing protein, partial [Actinotalea sp.]
MTTTRIATGSVPVAPRTSSLRPLGLDAVQITDGFWARRQEVNASATLPHIRHWLEREGWLANFDLTASGGLGEGRRGREFTDSEIYKYLEAVSWEVGRSGSPELEADLRAVVARVAAAQDADGYVNTAFGHPGRPPRWSDPEWGHELYCLGHLFQAAVARERTRPGADDGLLGIATRAADLVCTVFGPDGIASVCGHPEIEPALVELGRVTGRAAYVEQARLFVERRGHQVLQEIEFGRSYFQDDVPIREADVLRGHAVRANYLAAGAVDVAAETGDRGLTETLARQWDATVRRRTYVTGGQGSQHQDEAFGEDWMLPPDRAYSETCAAIGSIMFSWRLLLDSGLPRYADLIERTLFNVVATSPAHDGRSFFYANTLHRRLPGALTSPDEPSLRAGSSVRAPWFDVSCCPPNVARTLASLAGYLATATDDGIQLHQYAPCVVDTELASGRVRLEVVGDYPHEGRIEVRVLQAPTGPW